MKHNINLATDMRKGFQDLPEILTSFYERAGIAELWQIYGQQVQAMNNVYQPFASNAVRDIISYCRVDTLTTPLKSGRIHFTICPQLSHWTAFTESLGDDIYIIHGPPDATPGPDVFYHEALHHIINPLTDKHVAEIQRFEPLLKLAQEQLKGNYPEIKSVVNESFVRTIDKILSTRYYQHDDKTMMAHIINEYQLGFILCQFLAENLPYYESSGLSLQDYYPVLLQQVDVEREVQRWQSFWSNK